MAKSKSGPAFIYNYLPECLEFESTFDNILYNGEKIKSAYLLDLCSYFITQYLFFESEEISLSSTILREKYGANYTIYVQYLIDKKIIKLHRNYVKGTRSRIYKFDKSILNGEILNYQNSDKYLLKKFRTVSLGNEKMEQGQIETIVKEKLVKDLYLGELENESSESLLNALKLDKEVYLKNKHSMDCIRHGQIFFHFDPYGRMHSNFTNLKSIIRKNCLQLNGEKTLEIDIKNSQPLFFIKLIEEYSNMFDFDKKEVELYKNLTITGKFYDYLSSEIQVKNRKDIKDSVYKLLFGRNFQNKFETKFREIFPTIYEFIRFYKKEQGSYKIISHRLQKLESSLIFNNIVKKTLLKYPQIPLITIHDSLIVRQSDYNCVVEIFNDCMENFFGSIVETTFENV